MLAQDEVPSLCIHLQPVSVHQHTAISANMYLFPKWDLGHPSTNSPNDSNFNLSTLVQSPTVSAPLSLTCPLLLQNAFGVIGATPAAAAGEIAAVGLSDATQARMVRYELLAPVPFEDLWMYSGDAENVRALQEQEMVEKVMWDAVVSDPDGGREADWDRFSDALLASKLEASEAVQQELDELRAEFGA